MDNMEKGLIDGTRDRIHGTTVRSMFDDRDRRVDRLETALTQAIKEVSNEIDEYNVILRGVAKDIGKLEARTRANTRNGRNSDSLTD
jgi:hypothetical protein